MTSKLRVAAVRFAADAAPGEREAAAARFIKDCRRSAMARFRERRPSLVGCRTIAHPVFPDGGSVFSTGKIVAHLSPAFCADWERSVPGSLFEKRFHVAAEVHLALQDLADQEMHGYVAFTEAQRALFRPDLLQLVTESLDRTSFSRLGRKPEPEWEGTLVERVHPPYLVLDISLDIPDEGRGRPPKE